MIVEDEELILRGIKNIIQWEKLGLELIHMAHSAEEALELWRQQPVDMIVTDIEMQEMNGLELLRRIREEDERVRFLILTGYDTFSYAREAIRLEVEAYILKPINEEELEEQLLAAAARLDELEKKKIRYIDEKTEWMQFLSGKADETGYEYYREHLQLTGKKGRYWMAILKWSTDSVKDNRITDMLMALKEEETLIQSVHLPPDMMLLILEGPEDMGEVKDYLQQMQEQIEHQFHILCFISIGPEFSHYSQLPGCYQQTLKLQKYLLVEGYGSCVDETYVLSRKSEDITIDRGQLGKLILKKENEAAVGYIEDLFINNVKSGATVEALYQMTVQIAMLLQEIKKEYNLENQGTLHHLPDLLENIYRSDDIFGLKALFISEVNEMIRCLHEEDSQYTPVVRQIMEEVQKNYREDMNLKTLAYKYHMNASYLGQIFQKEVGCSFTQYLSGKKIAIAKDLILNTNQKISDIAREVGYPDTSYFYRKFKQYYGVAPVSLREMKKY